MMFSPSVHLVSGKGGVGKSTFALALAQHFVSQGQRTIVIELGEQSYASRALEMTGEPSYEPIPTPAGFSLALFEGLDCLKEYAAHLLHSKKIASLLLENRTLRTFVNIAPALREIAILGKITSHLRHHGPTLDADKVVVDAPSTGHFLSLLRAPRGLAETVRFGPMGEQSRSIQKVLSDPSQVAYWVVSLPEAFALEESQDLVQALRSEFQIEPQLVLNRAFPFAFVNKALTKDVEAAKLAREFALDMQFRFNETQTARAALRNLASVNLEIPLYLKNHPQQIINSAAELLRA